MTYSVFGSVENGHFVRLIHDGEVYDEAGPFDDEADALLAGERAVSITEDGYVR